MRRFLPILFTIALLMGVLLDTGSAAAAGPEILTINVDVTLLDGRVLLGSFVVQRGDNGHDDWTFNGMFAGNHVTVNGTVTEQWDTNGNGTIVLTSINGAGIKLDKLPVRTITLNTNNTGLITLFGLPLAVSGIVRPPGLGDSLLTITNAGQGPLRIASLPNTSGAVPLSPEVMAGLLFALGLGLLYLGTRGRRVA